MALADNIAAFLRQTPGRPYCNTCIRNILRVGSIEDIGYALQIMKRQADFVESQTHCSGCGQHKSTIAAR